MGEKVCVWVLREFLPWTWRVDYIAGNLPSVGGSGCGRYTSDSAPGRICLLPMSVIARSVKACFGSDASVIRLSHSSAVEVSISFPRHNILKVVCSHPCRSGTGEMLHKYLLLEWSDASKVLQGLRGGCGQDNVGPPGRAPWRRRSLRGTLKKWQGHH